MKVRNPRSGALDHEIQPLTPEALALEAARLRALQPAWAALAPPARSERLRALAAAMAAHRAPLLAALEADTGRRAVAKREIDSVIAMLTRWADRAPAILAAAEVRDQPGAMPGVSHSVTLVPYGLVGVISPWNFPLLLAMTDAVPALAAGCAVLVKPSEVTPRFVRPLMEAVAQVEGLPLALVEGDGATGAALVPLADFVAFTGSVATGRKVAEAAARAFVPASLELGGKDPLIVLEGADPRRAAAIALSASCRATGQACQSIERIYVARSLHDAFLDPLVEQAEAVRLNWPDIAEGDIGPFIFARQAEIVAAQLADAVAQGARVLTGGRIETHGGGLWLRPTVLADVTHAMAVMREETFGPVMPVMAFDTVDEAVALANDSVYGLSAAVVGAGLEEAEAVARRLHAGAVSLQDAALTSLLSDAAKSSFGLSGLGPSRAGEEGLLRFLRRRVLYAQGGQPLPLAAFSEG
ncbi:MAG: aldehyde dehydrogenase family protein [Sphingomonadaceae bacterium]